MAEQSPRQNSPLVLQLQATLAQLEQVVQQLDNDPEQRQSLTAETVERLQSSLEWLQNIGTQSAVMPTPLTDQTDLDNEWDEMFVDSFPSQPIISPKSQPQSPVTDPRTARPPLLPQSPLPRRQKPEFGILTAIATGLLGILVGILLWVGIPPLELPPLWDQIAARMPSLPISQPAELDTPPPDSYPDDRRDVSPPLNELPPVLEAPAPPTVIAVDPLPAAPLTPEQSLLAVIQQELLDLEGLYPPQLIQRLEPNFLASRLTLTAGENWGQFSAKQQQNLLDTLWQRAQKLSFQQLRLYGPDGNLIARSPVVGQEMVVLQSAALDYQ